MRRRIFLSYGHDEHADLARRLKTDLEANGNEVWFDEERLGTGADWEVHIEKGLEWVAAGLGDARVVLLMTPHSVRRPDGYCLNELARSLSRGLRILPVMVVWTEPPLSICRIQWLDFRDCTPIALSSAAYDTKFKRLLAAIEGDRLDFDGMQARLRSLLDPLPFDAEISEHLTRFSGREWMIEKVAAWLRDPHGDRIFWIVGPPGIGKTALAAKLTATLGDIVAFHLCRAGHNQKSDPRRCVLSLAYQLSTQLPDFETRLNALDLATIVPESDAQTLFDRLILQPLSGNFPPPGRTLAVLIDALDEATRDGRNALAMFLVAEFEKTPSWLRLVVTSRPDAEVMHPLQGISASVVNAAAPANLDDIRAFLQRELRLHLLDTRRAPEIVERILSASEGNFLYAEWVRREVLAGRMPLDDPARLPKGLGGIYAQFAARQWANVTAYRRDIGPALDIVVAAREPLSLALLGEILGWSEREEMDFIAALGSLFVISKGTLLPFHKSLVDWLTDRGTAGPYFVSRVDGDRRLAVLGWASFVRAPQALPDYFRRHLASHLLDAQRWAEAEAALTNLAFLESKLEVSGAFAIAADLAEAVSKLPAGRPLDRTLRLLQEAFRRELHFIARHPSTMFQCLWNLCFWFDSPETAAHYPGVSLPARNTSPKLYELMERWRHDKEARQPGFVWVRSLRPPSLPLGIGQVVLGSHTDEIHTVGLSADGRRLVSGSRDSTVRLWDATSGQELIAWNVGAPVYSAAISADGRLVAAVPVMERSVRLWDADSGRALNPPEPHEKQLHCVALSKDARFVAAGSDDATILVWEVASGRRIALLHDGKNRVESVAFSPDGQILLSGGGWGVPDAQYVRLWDWRNGELIGVVAAHSSLLHSVVFTPDGRGFASCCGDALGEYAIKLWSLEGAPARVLQGHTESVQDIGFSPDGQRLVSGARDGTVRVWNVDTGAQERVITVGNKVTSVGFMPDGRRVYSAGYDNVIRVWDDAGSAAQLPPRPDGRETIWRLAYSPDQNTLVTGFEHGRIEFWDARTGRPLGGVSGVEGPVVNLAFSPDSRRLAASTGQIPWEDESDPGSGHGNYAIGVYDVATCTRVGTLTGRRVKVMRDALHYSLDGRRLFAPLSRSLVVVWDAVTMRQVEELAGESAEASFTPPDAPSRMESEIVGAETIFKMRSTGREVAWLSQPLHSCAYRSDGRGFAGASYHISAHGNEGRKIDIVVLEGNITSIDAAP